MSRCESDEWHRLGPAALEAKKPVCTENWIISESLTHNSEHNNFIQMQYEVKNAGTGTNHKSRSSNVISWVINSLFWCAKNVTETKNKRKVQLNDYSAKVFKLWNSLLFNNSSFDLKIIIWSGDCIDVNKYRTWTNWNILFLFFGIRLLSLGVFPNSLSYYGRIRFYGLFVIFAFE